MGTNVKTCEKCALLSQTGGVLSLIECTLIEETDASDDDCKLNSAVYSNYSF